MQHLLGLYYACAVTCRYAAPKQLQAESENESVENLFERALALTVLEHTLLQVGLVDEDSKKPAWVKLQSIDFRRHVEWQTLGASYDYEGVLCNTLQIQHDACFSDLGERPPWRLVVLIGGDCAFLDVVFAWDHAVADGMSGKVFHQTLLKNLNLVTSRQSTFELQDHVLRLPDDLKLTPPLEDVLKFPVSASYLALEGWRALRPPLLSSQSPRLATWAPVKLVPYNTRIRLVEVQDEVLQNILRACHQHETTITGLLHALTLLSFSTRLSSNDARAFQIGTPFELRRFLSDGSSKHAEINPDELVGNFVAYFGYQIGTDVVSKLRKTLEQEKLGTSSVTETEKIIWSVAADFKKRMGKRLAAGTKNDTLGLTKLVGDWRKFMKDELKKPRAFSWEVSNLGVIQGGSIAQESDGHRLDRWSIDRAVFSQSATVGGPAYLLSPVTVKSGSLVISCTWQHEVVDEALAIGVARDLQTWLNDVGSNRPLSSRQI